MAYAKRPEYRRPFLKKREGFYTEQFELLEKGDVIKGRGGDLRIIQDTHKRDGKTYTISLLKIRPSWTSSQYTTYTSGDGAMFKPVKVQNKKIYELTYEKIMKDRKDAYRAMAQKRIEKLQKNIDTLKSV